MQILTDRQQGIINTVELAVDWGLPIQDELYEEYLRILQQRQQSQESEGQQSQDGEGQ